MTPRAVLLFVCIPSVALGSLAEGFRGTLEELSQSLVQKPVSVDLFEATFLGEALSACHATVNASESHTDGPCRQARYLDSLRRQVARLAAGGASASLEVPPADASYAQLFIDYIAVRLHV